MRQIDIENWARRDHFNFFTQWIQPHWNLCANVDVTAFYPAVKQRDVSITVALVYVLSRAANAIPEFRQRVRGEEAVEHEIVHPAVTILVDDDLFAFCHIDYAEDFSRFAARAAESIERVKENPSLKDDPERDDYLFMTAIPWVSFTSFMHPIFREPPDSVPRFAWGKFFEEGQSLKMPLSVQGHHAVIDGLHVGRYFAAVQALLDQPSFLADLHR